MPPNHTAHATLPGQSQSQPPAQKAAKEQLNLHYLELFYYVAKAGGISLADTVMPYTVQQPSLSRQLKELEAQAGTVLFERRPFRLSPAGEKLFAVVDQFFKELDGVREVLRAGVPELVRIAASPIVLRDSCFIKASPCGRKQRPIMSVERVSSPAQSMAPPVCR